MILTFLCVLSGSLIFLSEDDKTLGTNLIGFSDFKLSTFGNPLRRQIAILPLVKLNIIIYKQPIQAAPSYGE